MLETNEKNVILKTQLFILNDQKFSFADWQAELNAAIVSSSGFISLEILSPIETIQPAWLIIQRFETHDQMVSWKNSEKHLELLKSLKPLLVKDACALHEMEASISEIQGGITEVIITEVDPQKERHFRNWMAKIHQIEAKFPGFRGTYVQSPSNSLGKNWITLLQFDTLANLEYWLESEERAEILRESASLITSLERHRVVSSYAGWFSSIAKNGQLPPVWKQTMIVLLVLFPLVMFELKYLSPLLKGINPSVGTFVLNALSVTLLAWPMMPLALRFLSWWSSPSVSKSVSFWGTALILGLYALEIMLLFHFF